MALWCREQGRWGGGQSGTIRPGGRKKEQVNRHMRECDFKINRKSQDNKTKLNSQTDLDEIDPDMTVCRIPNLADGNASAGKVVMESKLNL